MCFFNLFFFPQTWEQITATINETFHPGKEDIQREMQKVKQKWYDLRTDFNRAKQHATGTGGGPRKAPFRWEEQVGRIMGDTNLQTGIPRKWSKHFFLTVCFLALYYVFFFTCF